MTLAEWLAHIERVHPKTIEMGLTRVATVKRALGLDPAFPLITVGGTNGKGSACAMLEAIYSHARYRVGCYTSPHLLRYNERVRIDREEAADEALARALSAVEAARGDVPLTYFEFSTLAAVWLFVEQKVDVGILEVGLGGRLDAVNVFDADCALVMSVDLDHMDYLGPTRDSIGYEKAGIFRAGRPAICSDAKPPATLKDEAKRIGAELLVRGRLFGYEERGRQWRYWGPHGERHGLPHPALRGEYQLANASACITAVDALKSRLPVAAHDIREGLLEAEQPGRFQALPGYPLVILDVAHNPAAAKALAQNLKRLPKELSGRTLAVFAMLKDKDIAGVIAAVKDRIDEWFVADTRGERGADASLLASELARAGVTEGVSAHPDVLDAYAQACDRATENDKIVVFGSFNTVAAVMASRERQRTTRSERLK